MKLERTAAVLDAVEATLAEGNAGVAGSFLTQYTAIVLYAEMEERIAEIVRSRLEQYSHRVIAGFLASSMADVIRRTPKSEISKLVLRFGEDFRASFNQLVDEKQVQLYSNVIEARHDVGHRRGSNITLAEVRKGQQAADHILAALHQCFEVSERAGEALAPEAQSHSPVAAP